MRFILERIGLLFLFLFSISFAQESSLSQWVLGPSQATIRLGEPSENIQLIAILGQGMAGVPIDMANQTGEFLPGYWQQVELLSQSPIQAPKSPMLSAPHLSIQGNDVLLSVELSHRTDISLQLRNAQGALVTMLWQGQFKTGNHSITVPIPSLATQNLFLVLDIGSQRKVYPFTPFNP